MPQSKPEVTPDSVCTLPVVPSCPICGHPLQRRQTVCSAKCRISRSRQRREAKLLARDARVRLLLTEALALLEPDTELPPRTTPRKEHDHDDER
jgi:predicted nucleic acid-binding Zn ribbon protein